MIQIRGKTLSQELMDGEVLLRPGTGSCITYQDELDLTLENVMYYRERVDVERDAVRAFLVEHVHAMCAIHGVHVANACGLVTQWDMARGSHRVAKQVGSPASSVLGRSDGRIWGGETPFSLNVVPSGLCSYNGVDRDFRFEAEGCVVHLSSVSGSGPARFHCSYGTFSSEIDVDLETGATDRAMVKRILEARSLAVTGSWSQETVDHALGDVIGDILGLGRIYGHCRVDLALNYHRATVGCALAFAGV